MQTAAIPPSPVTPQADATAIQEILDRTAFGAIKAVVGSDHGFVRKVAEKIPVVGAKDKDGKQKEVTINRDEPYSRTVRSIHQFGAHPKQWVALGTDLRAETEAELLTMIHALHGGPEAMRKAAKRIVYCAETMTEVDVYSMVDGKPAIVREVALLSDREPG